ncbi:MAG: tRNA 2-thiouridine(34) synthase MnmA [Candidatus Neomarinimicrobiota bacterium]
MSRIIIGMSGGVDSAVAASILVDIGYDVEAIFMKNWEDESEYCTAEQDYKDALQVCDSLNIPLHSVNFTKEYWNRVFKYFLEEYKNGRTPNPDILCNTEIKFKEFLNYAIDLGADKIATGHYVQISDNCDNIKLLKGLDHTKDQSYFLYGLNQHQISSTLFPIGNQIKSNIRKKAKKLGFKNFDKKDSVGICFIGERNIKDFLKQYLPANPGIIVTNDGTNVGQHDGLMYYTIGQRKGLGIGGGHSNLSGAWYVIEKNLENNKLVVAQGHNNPALYHKNIQASGIHWISGNPPKTDKLNVKIRYRGNDVPCTIKELSQKKIAIELEELCFGISPGQSAVFYDGEICLGGAIIDSYHN